MFSPFRIGVLIAALLLISFAGVSPSLGAPGPYSSLLTLHLPALSGAPAVPVASNWTYSGCWTPRSGSPCVDVYRDTQGRPWICKACRTTGNPGPGKCRQTTQAELDGGLWCS